MKNVFREPRTATALAEVMQAYMTAVSKKRGACIACVIGGKLSEGVNFSDDLARAVVIIGLPYPNVYSAFVSLALPLIWLILLSFQAHSPTFLIDEREIKFPASAFWRSQ